jgi:hypothetical protein
MAAFFCMSIVLLPLASALPHLIVILGTWIFSLRHVGDDRTRAHRVRVSATWVMYTEGDDVGWANTQLHCGLTAVRPCA